MSPIVTFWLVLDHWYSMTRSIFSYMAAFSFRKLEYPEYTTDLFQVTEKKISWRWIEFTLPPGGVELETLVVAGTDYMGSCELSYHMMAPTINIEKTLDS